ncbi:MAG: hypothetical protein JXD22_03105 [Sedimentisphaerales bacterium]|nr:hypothetical protein [Sedimentisphaerales bacterium]
MRKIMIAALVLTMGFVLSGCQTMTRDSEQQIQKYSRVSDMNRRMLAEDVDAIMLLDEPSSLSWWHTRRR